MSKISSIGRILDTQSHESVGIGEAQILIQRLRDYFHHHKALPLLYMTCFQSRGTVGKTWNWN